MGCYNWASEWSRAERTAGTVTAQRRCDVKDDSTIPVGYKRCTRCQSVLPVSGFTPREGVRDGCVSWCRGCFRQLATDKRRARGVPLKEPGMSPEEVRASKAAWARNHPEVSRVWKDAHRERVNELGRGYYARHREDLRRGQQRWRDTNRERFRAMQASWAARHPEKVNDGARRRRARMAGAVTEIFARQEVWLRDRGRCHICGVRCDNKHWHLDHLVPLSKGGPHTRANVAVACPDCNRRRSNTGPAQLRMFGEV